MSLSCPCSWELMVFQNRSKCMRLVSHLNSSRPSYARKCCRSSYSSVWPRRLPPPRRRRRTLEASTFTTEACHFHRCLEVLRLQLRRRSRLPWHRRHRHCVRSARPVERLSAHSAIFRHRMHDRRLLMWLLLDSRISACARWCTEWNCKGTAEEHDCVGCAVCAVKTPAIVDATEVFDAPPPSPPQCPRWCNTFTVRACAP